MHIVFRILGGRLPESQRRVNVPGVQSRCSGGDKKSTVAGYVGLYFGYRGWVTMMLGSK